MCLSLNINFFTNCNCCPSDQVPNSCTTAFAVSGSGVAAWSTPPLAWAASSSEISFLLEKKRKSKKESDELLVWRRAKRSGGVDRVRTPRIRMLDVFKICSDLTMISYAVLFSNWEDNNKGWAISLPWRNSYITRTDHERFASKGRSI